MPWTNYHSHTSYCDGKNKVDDYAKEAVRLGMAAYGYSSHAPVPFDCGWTVPRDKIISYIEEVKTEKQKHKDRLEIYLGLEVDYIPGVTGPCHDQVKKLKLDYTIGSIHFVDNFPDGEKWCIDWTFEFFMKGLKEIFKGDIRKAVKRFYELTCEMISVSPPDIIGHLDKIRIYNNNNCFFNENDQWYQEEIEQLLKLIKKKDIIVELNTRGYYRAGSGLYPNVWILEKIKKMDIPVSLNSDSHQPDEIISGFSYAAGILKDSGISEIWSLIGGRWKPFQFDISKGIVL